MPVTRYPQDDALAARVTDALKAATVWQVCDQCHDNDEPPIPCQLTVRLYPGSEPGHHDKVMLDDRMRTEWKCHGEGYYGPGGELNAPDPLAAAYALGRDDAKGESERLREALELSIDAARSLQVLGEHILADELSLGDTIKETVRGLVASLPFEEKPWVKQVRSVLA